SLAVSLLSVVEGGGDTTPDPVLAPLDAADTPPAAAGHSQHPCLICCRAFARAASTDRAMLSFSRSRISASTSSQLFAAVRALAARPSSVRSGTGSPVLPDPTEQAAKPEPRASKVTVVHVLENERISKPPWP